jgi:hypothetical protein
MEASLITPPQALSSSHGVQLRMSCPYIFLQNGTTERMIRTTNVVIRSLLFQDSLPARYWAESLYTATYILNLLPTKAISAPTSYLALFGTTPSYTHLQVFGCACYPITSVTAPHKLAPRSCRCVFLGYLFDHKGYRCLDLITNRLLISRHVIFDESSFPLTPPTHLPTTWTPSSRPVLQFARLLHPTPLLLQVLRSLSPHQTQPRHPSPRLAWPWRPRPHHTRPRRSSPRHTRPRRPRLRHVRPRLLASRSPPGCISDDIRPSRRVVSLPPHRRGL